MKKRSIVSVLILFFISATANLSAQISDPVLMTINGKPVTRSEFEYIYNKNNTNNALDKKSLEEYVDLFVNFKLKVEEAKSQGIDTTSSFITELAGYRAQLTRPYLTDSKVEEEVVMDAYNRTKEEVEVSHILIRLSPEATPADTLKAWNLIQAVVKRLQKEDFTKVAVDASEDPSVTKNKGYIGFISSFRTPYSFETAAYTTPVGSISKVVRTPFGYHVIKVISRRPSKGEVLVAHIMKFGSRDNATDALRAKQMIDSLYKRVLAGEDFGKLAAANSDDKNTALNGGQTPWFGSGQMVIEFENAAFALKEIGAVSAPVQSQYGWHIIKLIDKKGLAPFEEMKAELERKVKRDERAGFGQAAFVAKLKNMYGLKMNQVAIAEYYKLFLNKITIDSAFLANASLLNKNVFTFGNRSVSQKEFTAYLKANPLSENTTPESIIQNKIDAFVTATLLQYEDASLEEKYPDFRYLIQEYHDGILLFEVSNREVWDKASKDTEGLRKYFNSHRADYKWEKPHYKGYVILCKDEKTLKLAKTLVKRINSDSVENYLSKKLNDSIKYVKIEKGIFMQGENKVVDHFVFKSKDKYDPAKDYPYAFVSGKMLKFTPQDYTDVRGLVTADYQEFLENEWMQKLKAKYPVVINNDVLSTIKKN